ncbi:MAG: class SAM-dependent methyltransferase [Alphaproteobacteria bacterium]|jgi:SAM-dependent methyltransferase|nr:class SAM-dependent methyltransferase [Alphaproteobacteria bacterium]
MHGISATDPGNTIDWGKTSEDYAKYRVGQPDSFFDYMRTFKVGLNGQSLLDLGTGTGAMAIRFAQRGAAVSGIDVSEEQIAYAKKAAEEARVKIDFRVGEAEKLPFDSKMFDVVIANQCWLYFRQQEVVRQVLWALKDGGVLVTSHCSWLPGQDPVAQATEDLVREFNPNWTAHSWSGSIPAVPAWSLTDFRLRAFFNYDEKIQFSRDGWMGRIRACRGVGAALPPEKVAEFDAAHLALLKKIAPETFTVLHRIDAHILEPL